MSRIAQTLVEAEVTAIDKPIEASPPELTALDVAAAGSRWPLVLAIGMLFLGALPNGMVAPLLSELFVQRYGTGIAASHWFMAVNLLGAVAVVPVLARLRRRLPPSVLLAGAAVISGVLFTVMAMPIGFAWTLSLRVFEGAADLVMLAVIFDLLGKAGRARSRGARFGAAGTIMLLGIATGVVAGGFIGGRDPVMVFTLGALACFAIAAFALIKHASFDGLVRSCPVVGDQGCIDVDTLMPRRLWPSLLMTGSDRAVAGLATTTLLFYFALVLELDPKLRGLLLGGALLMIALGSWPAGVLADRVGHLRLRVLASLMYCGSLAMIPMLAPTGFAGALFAMLCFGLAGAALMPTSIVLASQSGRGSVAMGAYHASGNIGYHLVGIGGAAMLVLLLGGTDGPTAATYHTIIYTFAIVYGFISVLTVLAARRSC